MPNPGLGTLPKGLVGAIERRLFDYGRITGLLLDRIKSGPAAGRWITARPAVGTWAFLNACQDLLMTPGVEVRVLDVPASVVSGRKQKLGSAWRVGDPVDGTDPPQGLLEPMGPIPLGHNYGPIVLAASSAFQVAGLLSANPAQVLIPAGLLNSVRRRIRVEFLVTKAGTTDTFTCALFLGTAGTNADTAIFSTLTLTTALTAAQLQYVGSVDIAYVDATHVRVYNRSAGDRDTGAYAGGSIAVANLASNNVYLTLGVKTGTTDAPTVQDWQVTLS